MSKIIFMRFLYYVVIYVLSLFVSSCNIIFNYLLTYTKIGIRLSAVPNFY